MAALAVWLAASAAEAQSERPVDDARALFEQGVRAADAQRWAEAAEAFERSYALVPRPATLRNLGLADRSLGRYARAIRELERFLASRTAPPPIVREVQRLVDEMRTRVGMLSVTTDPTTASVTLDGDAITPGETQIVDPGRHLVVATARAYNRAEERFTLAPGERRSVTLTLAPAAVTQAVLPTPHAPTPATQHESVLTRWWFWTAIGAVVAGGVAASVVLLSSDASPDCGTLGRCLTPR